MSDLTKEQLDGMDMWDRDVMLDEQYRAVGAMLVRMAVAEIRRYRAGKERVREVVLRAIDAEIRLRGDIAHAIADRVAEQFIAPVQLSENERDDLEIAATGLRGLGRLVGAAVIDRLLGAASAPVTLPARKKWDAECHADAVEAGCERESSDYVDGWNDALDAVERGVPAAAPATLTDEERNAIMRMWFAIRSDRLTPEQHAVVRQLLGVKLT